MNGQYADLSLIYHILPINYLSITVFSVEDTMTFTSMKLPATVATVSGMLCLVLCAWGIFGEGRQEPFCRAGQNAQGAVHTHAGISGAPGAGIHYDHGSKAHYSCEVGSMLRYTYNTSGFSFQPLAGEMTGADWKITLNVAGIERNGSPLSAAPQPAVSVAGAEMLVDFSSFAVQYVRTDNGVRQNFLIRDRVPGADLLAVELQCETELDMQVQNDDLLFYRAEENTGGEPVAWYKNLHVWDATGRTLDAHMELAENTVRLLVDDTEALYPLTVDPLAGGIPSVRGNQSGEQLGFCAAGNLDVNGDGYDDIVISAPSYSLNDNQPNVGRVMLFLGSANGISTTASWTMTGDQAGAKFGWSVASAGDINKDGYDDVIIGAPFRSNVISGTTYTGAGKVSVFLGNATGLSTTAVWSVEANQNNAEFGWSVSGAGDIDNNNYTDIIIGAPKYDNGQTDEGRVFVYYSSSSGINTSPDWSAESDQASSMFGYSVASAGDINYDGYADIIIGSPGYDNGQTDEGRVYVYYGSSVGLGSSPWTAESDQVGAGFGTSVAGAGKVDGDNYADVIIGAPMYDNGQNNEGRIYLYLGSSVGLSNTANWTAESDQAGAQMGMCVAGAGDINNDGYDDIVVGAPCFDVGLASNVGRVYVYSGNLSGSPCLHYHTEGENTGDRLGEWVAPAGCLNSNNKGDLVIGAPAYSTFVNNGGKTYFIFDPELIYTKKNVVENPLAGEAGLQQVVLFPNPAPAAELTAHISLSEATAVQVHVTNSAGHTVHRHAHGLMQPGEHVLPLELPVLPSGSYVVTVTAGGTTTTQIVHIIR
jgi:hypothetical protein